MIPLSFMRRRSAGGKFPWTTVVHIITKNDDWNIQLVFCITTMHEWEKTKVVKREMKKRRNASAKNTLCSEYTSVSFDFSLDY